MARLALALGWLLAARGVLAVEGKWTPDQVLAHDPAWLRQLGLALPPGELWSPAGAGLLAAAVRITGCSAGFVSPSGLLLTNHHCAFALLQQHSTPERDLTRLGYLAPSREAELAGKGLRATVPHRTRDVTAEVEASVPAGADDLARFRAVERKKKQLVAACEQTPGRRCEAAAFDGGLSYQLIESLEFPDVRLVYAPPRAVGDYGGEEDNWSWPRHAGDFALLRVYAGLDGRPAAAAPANVPYRPSHFFPLSPAGIAPGGFVMVAGYPGLTFRALTAAEMAEPAELSFPARAELYRKWMDLMEAASAGPGAEAARIALSDRLKNLANREKNARGQIAGLARGRILEHKRAAEQEVLAWARREPRQAEAVAAHDELAELATRRRAVWPRRFWLEQARLGPKPLDLALTVVRWAHERERPDLERDPAYMERNRERALDALRNDQQRLHPATEEALLVDVLRRAGELPAGGRVAAVDRLFALGPSVAGGAGATGAAGPGAGEAGPAGTGAAGSAPRERPRHPQHPQDAAMRAKAHLLLAHSRVGELDERMKMFGESAAALRARRDPLLDFAFDLLPELLGAEEDDHRFQGAVSRLRPRWQRAVIAQAGRPVAPDANGTLRVSFAHVSGYSPRDGVFMEPQTTVAGMAEKATGRPPFDAPAGLLAAAPRAPAGPFADPRLRDVPVCFLADGDTTGGNSGSPVLNGRGELVGVNFDRVWENVANDFGYNPAVARSIATDVRYLLWVLTTLAGDAARPLLQELGLKPDHRGVRPSLLAPGPRADRRGDQPLLLAPGPRQDHRGVRPLLQAPGPKPAR